MPRIFISYRRDDSAGHAGRIHDRLLEHYGADNLFIDVDTLGPGIDFVEAVREAVIGCDQLIAVIGREWLEITGAGGGRRLDDPQDLVKLEIATALDRGIPVIPVLVQGARAPRAEDLPDALKRLANLNALEVSDLRFHSDLSRLIEALGYISPGQARELALRAVQESPGLYGRRYRDVPMVFEVVDSHETEDHYLVTLSFRPQGRIGGNPGLEQVTVGKEGTVVSRQVLSLPGGAGTPRRPVVLAGIVVLAVVVAIGTVVLTGSVGIGDFFGFSSAAAPDPTATIPPTPTATPEVAKAESPRLTAEDVQVIISKALEESREGGQGQSGPVNTQDIVVSVLQQIQAAEGSSLTSADVEQMVVQAAAEESTPPAPLLVTIPTPPATPTRRPPPTATPISGFAAGYVVDLGYNSALYLNDRSTIKNLWEPGETDYALRWEAKPQPVMLTAVLNTPLHIDRGGEPRPFSFTRESDKYVYRWRPSGNFRNNVILFLIREVSTDAGLRMSRSATPEVLPPGRTEVLWEAAAEILRPPTIEGVRIEPVGGRLSMRGPEGALAAGMESWSQAGIRPMKVISAAGVAQVNLGPLFEGGRTYSVRLQAVIENPNPFPVTYLPRIEVTLDIDVESATAPFLVAMPQPLEPLAESVTVQAVGISGETVEFTFSNPSEEKVFWKFREPYFKGIWHSWQQALAATP